MNVLDQSLVEDVAARLSADPGLIEKDWHVTHALSVIAVFDHGDAQPAFAGGTSLSKGWGLIKRFSEDIDFKVSVALYVTLRHTIRRYQYLIKMET
jgi:predicted nucleotidyltransferase component of viral defense system